MKRQKSEIMQDIITVLTLLGTVSTALIAPNALILFGKKYNQLQINKSLHRLKKNKSIKLDSESRAVLTAKGHREYLKHQIDELQITKKKDGKWRFVLFDIPNRLSRNRSEFTQNLKKLGFRLYQKSVWITPFVCEEEISLLVRYYKIKKYVIVAHVAEFKNKNQFEKLF